MMVRAAAAQTISEVLAGKSLTDALQKQAVSFDARDQALLQALCYGVCRHYFFLQGLLKHLLTTPLKDKDRDVYALLLVGLLQLIYMRIPDYAAVGETVNATKTLKKPWAKALVNAVLRNYQRQAEKLATEVAQDAVTKYSHPLWLIERLKKHWPTQWENILNANNEHPPLMLRVNANKITRKNYLAKLTAKGIAAELIEGTENGLRLAEACDVAELPGFEAGEVSVQDGAAQLAATILNPEPAMRVLDACAAPGGKTAHLAEYQPHLKALLALDQDAERLQKVKTNLKRLQLSAHCEVADAADTSAWWDGKLFERILLDAPCSATGVIRRHPDIKLLRREQDIPNLVAVQEGLLTALWPLLNKNGLLLYATCSVLPEENNELIRRFLATHKDAREEKISTAGGLPLDVGQQILPGTQGMDGFYYALLRKC